MFISLFDKKRISPTCFSRKVRSVVITLYIWRRETSPFWSRKGPLGLQWGLRTDDRDISGFCTNLKTCRRLLCITVCPSFEDKLFHLLYIRRCVYDGARPAACLLTAADTVVLIITMNRLIVKRPHSLETSDFGRIASSPPDQPLSRKQNAVSVYQIAGFMIIAKLQ